MRRRPLVLLVLLGLIGVSFASASQEREVPLMIDQHDDLSRSAYVARSTVNFTVVDCTSGRPLWTAAQKAADTWNADAPVRIDVRLAEDRCSGSANDRINEVYFRPLPVSDAMVGDYQYRVESASGRFLSEDVRVDPSQVVERARELDTGSAIVIFNQVLHGFGNALGLGDAYLVDPDGCNWSAMLRICSLQRRVPSAADLDALERLYSVETNRGSLPPRLRQFDENDNSQIDDDEFLHGVERWIAGEVSDSLLSELVEVWSRQRSEGSSLAYAEPPSPSMPSERVRVFNLAGQLAFERPCSLSAMAQSRQALRTSSLPTGSYVVVRRNCLTGELQRSLLVKRP